MATRTRVTVINGYHVDVEDEAIETIEKVQRFFEAAYPKEDYLKMIFEYRGSPFSQDSI